MAREEAEQIQHSKLVQNFSDKLIAAGFRKPSSDPLINEARERLNDAVDHLHKLFERREHLPPGK